MGRLATLQIEGFPESLEPGKFRTIFIEEALRGADEMVELTQGAVKLVSPVVTGHLRDSWQAQDAVETSDGVLGIVSINEVSALVNENGTENNPFPPIDPRPALETWIQRKLGISDEKEIRSVAWRISRSISSRGLPSSANSSRKGAFSRAVAGLAPKFSSILDGVFSRTKQRFGI